jgi:hypothetical protein
LDLSLQIKGNSMDRIYENIYQIGSEKLILSRYVTYIKQTPNIARMPEGYPQFEFISNKNESRITFRIPAISNIASVYVLISNSAEFPFFPIEYIIVLVLFILVIIVGVIHIIIMRAKNLKLSLLDYQK